MFIVFANALHTVGVAYFLVFGSQPDVLWAWCFWRKDETGSRATAESGAPIIEDSTALHKHPTLPDTSHEVCPVFSPIYTPQCSLHSGNVQLVVISTQTEA
jgi:hypothetical protein